MWDPLWLHVHLPHCSWKSAFLQHSRPAPSPYFGFWLLLQCSCAFPLQHWSHLPWWLSSSLGDTSWEMQAVSLLVTSSQPAGRPSQHLRSHFFPLCHSHRGLSVRLRCTSDFRCCHSVLPGGSGSHICVSKVCHTWTVTRASSRCPTLAKNLSLCSEV